MGKGTPIPSRSGEGDRAAKPRGGGGPPPVLRAPIKDIKAARRFRREISLPEILLWQQLRKRPAGFKFRRQTPQPGYKLDFACLETRLAKEVDGEAHDRGNRPQRDAVRDRRLELGGFTTLRIPARDVLRDLASVITAIVSLCRERGPLHRSSAGPPPRSGEE